MAAVEPAMQFPLSSISPLVQRQHAAAVITIGKCLTFFNVKRCNDSLPRGGPAAGGEKQFVTVTSKVLRCSKTF